MTKISAEAALGAIALGSNNHPKGMTPKLDSVGTDPDERFYMLATFCFDLCRKLKYISLALEPYWEKADPCIARRVLDDNEFINPGPGKLPWKDMAYRSEDAMKNLWKELHDVYHHDEKLKERAALCKKPGHRALEARSSFIRA
jgi:hypothetical protein